MKIFIFYLFIIISFAKINISFTYDKLTNLLKISGNGIIHQYNINNQYKEGTKEITIENGITEIENGIFNNWNNLNKIN